MSRVIKFRAWDGQKFTLGDVGYASEGYIDAQQLNEVFTAKTIVFQQFTGLLDKNGREIYEGDIVQNSAKVIWWVEWSDGKAKWEYVRGGISEMPFAKSHFGLTYETAIKKIEVIGNIYENPELIKP